MKNIYIALIAIFVSACSSNEIDTDKNSAAANSFVYSSVQTYYIGVDDVLQVNVWKNPDLSVTVPVRPDGKISVPLIGDVLAGGKEPMQVAREVKKSLSKYIREPQVAVILTSLQSHEFISRIRITGAVMSPKE